MESGSGGSIEERDEGEVFGGKLKLFDRTESDKTEELVNGSIGV
jgi:hypothetical protein